MVTDTATVAAVEQLMMRRERIILISVTERTAGCLVSSISCVPTVKPITQIETLSGKISPSPSPGCDDAGSCPVPSDRQLRAPGRGGAGLVGAGPWPGYRLHVISASL